MENSDNRIKKTVRLSPEQVTKLEMLRNRFRVPTDQQVFDKLLEEHLRLMDALENMTTRYNKAVREKEDLRMAAAGFFAKFEALKSLSV